MKIITMQDIRNLNLPYSKYLEWIDYPLRHRNDFLFPTKSRMTLTGSDYCNLMPCALPANNTLGIKVINRNNERRSQGRLNLDSQIFLYSFDTCDLKAVLDGNFITTVRTAAVAVHTIMHMAGAYDTVSLVGLGNIMNAIGEIWFPTINRELNIMVMKYKDHAEKFVERFSRFDNLHFEICDTHDALMADADLILSAVSYTENDFCDSSVYKKGCTVIPVHLRGFMDCDKTFDNIIVSDLERAKGFKYYDQMRRITYTDDILNQTAAIRNTDNERVIIYNFGLAITDLYFAGMILPYFSDRDDIIQLGTDDKYYI